jgi:hypothetical protein
MPGGRSWSARGRPRGRARNAGRPGVHCCRQARPTARAPSVAPPSPRPSSSDLRDASSWSNSHTSSGSSATWQARRAGQQGRTVRGRRRCADSRSRSVRAPPRPASGAGARLVRGAQAGGQQGQVDAAGASAPTGQPGLVALQQLGHRLHPRVVRARRVRDLRGAAAGRPSGFWPARARGRACAWLAAAGWLPCRAGTLRPYSTRQPPRTMWDRSSRPSSSRSGMASAWVSSRVGG